MKYLCIIIMIFCLAVPVFAANHSYTGHPANQTTKVRNTKAHKAKPQSSDKDYNGWKVPKAHHKHKWFERHR